MKSQFIIASTLLLATCDLFLACDAAPSESAEEAVEAALEEAELDTIVALDGGNKGPGGLHRQSAVVMPEAKATFEQVLALIEEQYIEGPLGDDAIWSGATEGVLSRLVQLEGHPVNTLLSPEELGELEAGTKGSIVGVGVAIEKVADVVVVRDVIPGSPAAGANLKAGDRILGVDGERLRGMELVDIVHRIRGEAGSKIELFVQRDTEEWTETVERGTVEFASVEGQLLDGGVGLLKVRSFSAKTSEEARAHLEALSDGGMTSLVLDLRECPGGLLETAVETAGLLVPEGKPIVVIEHREKEDDVRVSNTQTPWQGLPTVTLVGRHTASGAEILAEALTANDRTVVLGEETIGKGTVESIHELQNGWALKLSVSRFHAPDSDRAVGEGIEPDIVIPDPRSASGGEGRDVQLDAALEVLGAR